MSAPQGNAYDLRRESIIFSGPKAGLVALNPDGSSLPIMMGTPVIDGSIFDLRREKYIFSIDIPSKIGVVILNP